MLNENSSFTDYLKENQNEPIVDDVQLNEAKYFLAQKGYLIESVQEYVSMFEEIEDKFHDLVVTQLSNLEYYIEGNSDFDWNYRIIVNLGKDTESCDVFINEFGKKDTLAKFHAKSVDETKTKLMKIIKELY